MTDVADGADVVVPAGLPLSEAAAWVGHACWAELRFHETLTRWLALDADPAFVTALWAVRAHRAELAEAWHRRLPELRELPREGFVRPSDSGEQGFAALDALTAPEATAARARALTGAFEQLASHYEAHVEVAVGPADAPTADTLHQAITRTRADADLVRPFLAT
ncbi:hypothetical protein KSP35_17235 [Aquihabitans sp. G128]|uniref:hypothetical protein n=1 Tax=Aquihabitans sp. G128 TaxID=2849779 RepID=UPI001C2214F0|nr:hypothetical protein [Aquihabitans sp. G128]QXC60089.1 hypothetical protein KSP35_17235 [Aquihabitans sp. G128]